MFVANSQYRQEGSLGRLVRCATELQSCAVWQHQEKGAIFAKVKRIKVGKDPRTDQEKRTLRSVIERVKAFAPSAAVCRYDSWWQVPGNVLVLASAQQMVPESDKL